MVRVHFSDRLDALFQEGKWQTARQLLETEQINEPDNHWLLTQIGVTWYEQQQYEKAQKLFLASLERMPECPLTLWNLAGTLDALEKPAKALQTYSKLLASKTTPEEDPCWESKEWTEALKTDTIYRVGLCFQHLGKKTKAEHCFRLYLDLLLVGAAGTYPIATVTEKIRKLQGNGKSRTLSGKLRKGVQLALEAAGAKPKKGYNSGKADFE